MAQIRFAEDDDDDFLDTAGMDESDLTYMQSFGEDATPEWKQEKRQRSAGAEDDSLEAMIGASEDTEGVEADALAPQYVDNVNYFIYAEIEAPAFIHPEDGAFRLDWPSGRAESEQSS